MKKIIVVSLIIIALTNIAISQISEKDIVGHWTFLNNKGLSKDGHIMKLIFLSNKTYRIYYSDSYFIDLTSALEKGYWKLDSNDSSLTLINHKINVISYFDNNSKDNLTLYIKSISDNKIKFCLNRDKNCESNAFYKDIKHIINRKPVFEIKKQIIKKHEKEYYDESFNIFCGLGGNNVNLSDFNNFLTQNNYPTIKSKFTFADFGFEMRLNRTGLFMYFSTFGFDETDNKIRKCNFGGSSTDMGIYYDIINKCNLKIFPIASMYSIHLSLNMKNDSLPVNSFTNQFLYSNNNISIPYNGDGYRLGAGVEYLYQMNEHLYLIYRISGGYNFYIGGDWGYDTNKIINGPNINLNGAFINVILGLSYKFNDMKGLPILIK